MQWTLFTMWVKYLTFVSNQPLFAYTAYICRSSIEAD